jgi:hypothetical protein
MQTSYTPPVFALAPLLVAALLLGCAAEPGRLDLAVVDAATGEVTPARVEILTEDGKPRVPPQALTITLQCVTSPPPEWAEWWVHSDRIRNPATGTVQFYLDRPAQLELPPGRYRLRAFKGIEYRVEAREIEIRPGETAATKLALERWIDAAAEGWYGADDHIHVTRRTREDDVRIARWMRAEDLRVANLLQMGTQAQFGVTPQRAFGDAGAYRLGDTLILAGQEHPRTHLLGHTITLGARAPIDLRETYIVYDGFWRAAQREGGVSGYAHFGLGPARDGLAIDAPGGRISFIEVLQFEFAHYDVWYEILNLGIPMTPTAGTDFPCGPWSVPGRERFYTRLDGPLERETWLEGVRRGRTFVTNGPIPSFEVNGAGPGDELRLPAPGRVRIRGRVRFDPERDDVRRVELVGNGEVLPLPTERSGPGEIRFDMSHEVSASSWFALRAAGEKRGEAPLAPMPFPDWILRMSENVAKGASMEKRRAFAKANDVRPTAAHTAAVYVTVEGTPGIGSRDRAAALARASLARLDDLEARLAPDRIDEQTIWDWAPYSDGVSAAHLRRNRDALLAAIAEARRRYAAQLE